MKKIFLALTTIFAIFAVIGCGTTGGAVAPDAAPVVTHVEVDPAGPLVREYFYGAWFNGNASNPITITVRENSLEFKNENPSRAVLVKCAIETWGEEEDFDTSGAGLFRALKITGTVTAKDKWNNPGDYMRVLFGEDAQSLGPFTAWLGCKQPEDLQRDGAGLSLLGIQKDGVTKAAFWRNNKRQ
jgi:predicted small lipoprotein YifL